MRQGNQDMHQLQELVRLHRLGHGPGDVAGSLQLDPKTERKYRGLLRLAGLLDGPAHDLPELAALRQALVTPITPPHQERSSVEGLADFIDEKRRAGLGPTAIHALLAEQRAGFSGSLSAVKRLYKRLKKAAGPRAEDVAIPVHTAPGKQAQVDFGYIGKLFDPATKRKRKAWVFVMVLSHSRVLFACVVFSQDVPTWLDLHRRAFAFFGGVPEVIVPDNLKSAVIKAAFKSDEMGEVNRSYRELARHYGFRIDPTPAYSPEKKGKVESAVKYVKGAFFKPRADTLLEIDDTNKRLMVWVQGTANPRVHGTTKRHPIEVFEAVEKDALLGLPGVAFVPILWHRGVLGRNCHITFRGRFYSAPWTLIGNEAWLKIRGNALTVYIDDDRVAEHRLDGLTPWSTVPAHLPEGRRDLALRDPDLWFERAAAIGDDVEAFARAVMDSDDVVFPLRRVQSIVRKLEALTPERAVSVVQRAARFACYRPDAIARIIAAKLDLDPTPGAWVDSEWATSPRFARQSSDFLRGGGYGNA